MEEVSLSFLQRVACVLDLERRYLQSDRTVWTKHINAVRATITQDEWSLIRQLSDDVRQTIPGAHTVSDPTE